jgi:hypothetical protein
MTQPRSWCPLAPPAGLRRHLATTRPRVRPQPQAAAAPAPSLLGLAVQVLSAQLGLLSPGAPWASHEGRHQLAAHGSPRPLRPQQHQCRSMHPAGHFRTIQAGGTTGCSTPRSTQALQTAPPHRQGALGAQQANQALVARQIHTLRYGFRVLWGRLHVC